MMAESQINRINSDHQFRCAPLPDGYAQALGGIYGDP